MFPVFDLFLQIIPLFLICLLGFIGGKFLDIGSLSIVSIVFYLITPIILFNSGLEIEMRGSYLLLPLMLYVLACIVCLAYLKLLRPFIHDRRVNFIAYAAGASNCGYFGLPVILLLFDKPIVDVYMLAIQGLTLYEFTVGTYIIARGQYTKKQALRKVLRLPMLYSFSLGLILNYYHVELPTQLVPLVSYMQKTYIVLGMMLIGISLSNIKRLKLDLAFLSFTFSAKFLCFPILVYLLMLLDKNIFGLYTDNIHCMLLILSMMPPPVNTVVFATLNGHNQEEAAATVLIGTIIATIYIPAVLYYLS